MANSEHLTILKQGVAAWNDWRVKAATTKPDLSRFEFRHRSEPYSRTEKSQIPIVKQSPPGAEPLQDTKATAESLMIILHSYAGINLNSADLRGSNLTFGLFDNASFVDADLSDADLSYCDASYADFTRAKLVGARMSNATMNSACFANADLSVADLKKTALDNAVFFNAVLDNAKLHDAILSCASLNEADLSLADLSRANLQHANFDKAKMRRANLSDADLRGANLSGSFLWVANLNDAALGGANLSGALLNYTNFCGLDLSATLGLDTAVHQGPSFVDIQTIYKSQGKLPVSFLRGIGAPDTFIAYIESLTGPAIRFYSCFISHSTRDQAFADRLHTDLQGRGIRCWFAPHDIQGGKKLYDQIDEAIRVYDRLLLILSDASMNSEWVKTEIANARQREIRKGRQMLFPISLVPYDRIKEWRLFDADTGKDSAREIREYFIPDFSNWKDHDSYERAFQRLLRDLKAEGTASA